MVKWSFEAKVQSDHIGRICKLTIESDIRGSI